MGKSSQAPQAPDPYVVAGANTQQQKEASAYNAAMRSNTYTPYGSQTYEQYGYDPTTGAPLYNEFIDLSPTAQRTVDQNIQNQYDTSVTANKFLKNAESSLSNPINTSDLNYQTSLNTGGNAELSKKAQDAIYGKQTALLDPQYQQNQDALNTRLANQGINIGSEAYDREMNNFARQKDYAYGNARNDSILGGIQYENQLFNQSGQEQQAYNNAISAELNKRFAGNNQALNQYTALASGSQVQTPQFANQPIQNVQPTDMSQLFQNQYNSQLAGYNADVAGGNSLLGGVFGLGSAALGSPVGTFAKLFGG